MLLRYLAGQFEAGRTYLEMEASQVLAQFHEDVATLRRELVGYDLMARNEETYVLITERLATERASFGESH